jgi:hypothetical protein
MVTCKVGESPISNPDVHQIEVQFILRQQFVRGDLVRRYCASPMPLRKVSRSMKALCAPWFEEKESIRGRLRMHIQGTRFLFDTV